MLSPTSSIRNLFPPAARFTVTPKGAAQTSEEADFQGRISRRLSVIIGFLFFLVLVGGGISLYLAYNIYLNTQELRKERDRIALVNQMHNGIRHFISGLQRAIIRRVSFPSTERTAYVQELNYLVELYRRSGGGEKEFEEKIPFIIGELASLSDKFTDQNQHFSRSLGSRLSPQDLERLSEAERKIELTAHRLSAGHSAKMDQRHLENQERIKLILGFYAGFVFLGTVLILGFSAFFYRTISQPLRRLAAAASQIAEGNLDKKVQVTSKDEIGQLSHAFNIMTDRLKEHEERLKGLAALEERGRIAQELHDTLAQEIALLHLKIIEADQGLSNGGVSRVKETLEEMRKIAEGAYENVRQAIFGLRTMVSRSLGLIPSIAEYLHDFSEVRKIPVEFKADALERLRFSPQVEIQLIRIIHEACTNIFKHAEAKCCAVKFEHDKRFAKVTIEDNGKGCALDDVTGKGLHFGLQTMRERAEGVGGVLTVESSPGRGTKVMVYLPLDEKSYETDSSASG